MAFSRLRVGVSILRASRCESYRSHARRLTRSGRHVPPITSLFCAKTAKSCKGGGRKIQFSFRVIPFLQPISREYSRRPPKAECEPFIIPGQRFRAHSRTR